MPVFGRAKLIQPFSSEEGSRSKAVRGRMPQSLFPNPQLMPSSIIARSGTLAVASIAPDFARLKHLGPFGLAGLPKDASARLLKLRSEANRRYAKAGFKAVFEHGADTLNFIA